MRRFVVGVIVNAIALWLTTVIVHGVAGSDAIHVRAYHPVTTLTTVVTFLLLGLLFGVVNGVLGTAIRIVAFPLYLLTLGLISLIVNGLLFVLVAWISNLFGFGLFVSSFGWGVLGALILAILAWLVGLVLRPLSGRTRA